VSSTIVPVPPSNLDGLDLDGSGASTPLDVLDEDRAEGAVTAKPLARHTQSVDQTVDDTKETQ
jgi:L-aspartate oxidase